MRRVERHLDEDIRILAPERGLGGIRENIDAMQVTLGRWIQSREGRRAVLGLKAAQTASRVSRYGPPMRSMQ